MCGCVSIEDALPVTLSTIREDGRQRLPRTEVGVADMTDDERAIVYGWLTTTLRRPPLEHATTAGPFGTLVSFLEGLRWDLLERTSDPDSPVAAGWVIPMPHPRVIAADRGETTIPGSGLTLVVDNMGMTA
jgi:hypothetical protein